MFKNQLSLIPYNVFLIIPPLPDTHTLRGSTSDTHPPNFVLIFPYPDRFLSPSCIDCGPQSMSYLFFLPQGKKCPILGFPKAHGSCPNTLEEQVPEEDRLGWQESSSLTLIPYGNDLR